MVYVYNFPAQMTSKHLCRTTEWTECRLIFLWVTCPFNFLITKSCFPRFGVPGPNSNMYVCVGVEHGASNTASNNFWTPAECSRLEFNSNTIYPEIALDPTGDGPNPARMPPPTAPTFRHKLQVQVCICTSDRGPRPPPWVQLICLELFTALTN